jgi:hypothetical protein
MIHKRLAGTLALPTVRKMKSVLCAASALTNKNVYYKIMSTSAKLCARKLGMSMLNIAGPIATFANIIPLNALHKHNKQAMRLVWPTVQNAAQHNSNAGYAHRQPYPPITERLMTALIVKIVTVERLIAITTITG